MGKIISVITLFLVAGWFFVIPFAYAGDGEALFQSKCGKCHKSGGEGPEVSPAKYAASQWQRFFEKNKHGKKKDISGEVPAADQEAVKQYLMSHAADSDAPVADGIR